jgi:hypothetical protein
LGTEFHLRILQRVTSTATIVAPMPATPSPAIIGGMFGLELGRTRVDMALPSIFSGRHALLATARSAFVWLVRDLQPATVWLPSFLCPVVLPPLADRVRFFPIDETLHVADMVVFVDYFGFRLWDNVAAAAAARGAWIVEDAAQALLSSHFSPHSHYVVTSPRKFLGVPDGCVLQAQGDARLPASPLAPLPTAWWLDALRASVNRREFDRHGGSREWFDLFQATEASIPTDPTAMSETTAILLGHAIDWETIADRRRRNYEFLARKLSSLALLPDLPDGVVPLGFPLRVRDRDRLRHALFAQQIYPAVHWLLGEAVPTVFDAAHRLSASIMTVPCDQRYTPHDLQRVVDCLAEHGCA